MGKRKKHAEEHENLERWLVSYADFITLLFATFVVLYALSQIDLAKFKDLKVSLRKAFSYSPTVLEGDAGVLSNKGENVFDSDGYMDEQNMVPTILDEIAAKEEQMNYGVLQEELKTGKDDDIKGVKTRVTERGLIIRLVGNIFFEPSASEIKEQAHETVKKIGQLLHKKFPYNIIRVEGHSDNIPMANSDKFPSNWELSAARAASIVRYFTDFTGIEKDRFVVVGYGETRPIADNDTEAGRNANRRVEIVVLRSKMAKTELQTFKFRKKRIERLKKIEEILKKGKTDGKDDDISDAAKKLLEETKRFSKQIIRYEDSHDREARELEEELKKYEEENDPKIKKKLFFKSVQKELKTQED